ncbi:MAG: Por secretion system protein [Alistipes sp.]|nr:Por secretion system protein [Alistipes sp.]
MKKFNLLLILAAMIVACIGCEPGDLPNNGNGNGNGNGELPPPELITNQAPLISTTPTFITEDFDKDVLVIINAAGTGLDNYTGDVYAHTGVLTTASTGPGDWKHVKHDWNVNDNDCKLTRVANNTYTLTITGGPRAFYGVSDAEQITHLAFVFRSADGAKEMKDNGNDIFVELFESGLAVKITNPTDRALLKHNAIYTITVASADATEVSLYKNDELLKTVEGGDLTYQYTTTTYEDIVFKATATDGADTVEDSINVAVLNTTQEQARPAGAKEGVTVNGDEATFVLYAPGKQSVILLGDFNNYAPTNKHSMMRDGDYFWVTVDGLEPNTEYGYQFLVDSTIKVGDPYATKILDPWNDKWIESSVYPNLKAYPADYTTDIVSVFNTTPEVYSWEVTDFDRPAENSLAIYELLVRDFTIFRTIKAVTGQLDYFENLGINAIELMPIQEFDGNDSWGYNPCFYFAADKAYGTVADYKQFIDECHKRGIAVILDVVFNHATGQFPWAKMWWNSAANKTAQDNPFFNVDAPHDFSVYHDFKHTYPKTREYFKDVLKYWLEEYKVDGFRFDLTKGLVQNPSSYAASGYSAERIEILCDYARAIREVSEDAYIIFEHFCDQAEESKLYNEVGALCWNNNQMEGYMESVMGWAPKSSFSDFKRGRINNIETHDEERIAYKAITYGDSWIKNDWSVISPRLQAVYAFHFLTPYPSMLWQFGELGYDFSINSNENGVLGDYRTHRKPIRWDYFDDPLRKEIYNTLSKVLKFRNDHEADIYGLDNVPVTTWKVGPNDMGSKILVMEKVIMVANFSSQSTSTDIKTPSTGKWKNLISGAEVTLGETYTAALAPNQFVILVKE